MYQNMILIIATAIISTHAQGAPQCLDDTNPIDWTAINEHTSAAPITVSSTLAVLTNTVTFNFEVEYLESSFYYDQISATHDWTVTNAAWSWVFVIGSSGSGDIIVKNLADGSISPGTGNNCDMITFTYDRTIDQLSAINGVQNSANSMVIPIAGGFKLTNPITTHELIQYISHDYEYTITLPPTITATADGTVLSTALDVVAGRFTRADGAVTFGFIAFFPVYWQNIASEPSITGASVLDWPATPTVTCSNDATDDDQFCHVAFEAQITGIACNGDTATIPEQNFDTTLTFLTGGGSLLFTNTIPTFDVSCAAEVVILDISAILSISPSSDVTVGDAVTVTANLQAGSGVTILAASIQQLTIQSDEIPDATYTVFQAGGGAFLSFSDGTLNNIPQATFTIPSVACNTVGYCPSTMTMIIDVQFGYRRRRLTRRLLAQSELNQQMEAKKEITVYEEASSDSVTFSVLFATFIAGIMVITVY